MSSAEAFVGSLYGQPKLDDVNEARYKIFRFKDAVHPNCHDAAMPYSSISSVQTIKLLYGGQHFVDIQHCQVLMAMVGLLNALLLNKI